MKKNFCQRYERNLGSITQAEQECLESKKAVIVGCGGLGAYAAEMLARAGLGHLTLIDGDVFTESNLNRQLNSLETNLGKNKASQTEDRLHQFRHDLSVKAVDIFLDEENAFELLKGYDVIIDGLDNIKNRLLVEKTAAALGIPFVHGAVKEWSVQVTVIFPGDSVLGKLYPQNAEIGKPSVLSFTPAFCASLQVSEAIKVLLGREDVLRKKLLIADIKKHNFEIVNLY